MAPIDPDQIPKLGVAAVDQDHAQEARLLRAALAEVTALQDGRGSVGAVKAAVDALYEFTRAHFSREEQAMAAAGFPSLVTHRTDHARVLAELDAEERLFLERGDVARLAAYLSNKVPSWFEDHLRTLDLASTRFTRQWGS